MCKREKERLCEGEIHYSDNESIWDSMRQFTSPVVVSTIRGEDTLPARSQRTPSGGIGLVSMPAAGPFKSTVECASLQEVSSLYLRGCVVFVLWLKGSQYIQMVCDRSENRK